MKTYFLSLLLISGSFSAYADDCDKIMNDYVNSKLDKPAVEGEQKDYSYLQIFKKYSLNPNLAIPGVKLATKGDAVAQERRAKLKNRLVKTLKALAIEKHTERRFGPLARSKEASKARGCAQEYLKEIDENTITSMKASLDQAVSSLKNESNEGAQVQKRPIRNAADAPGLGRSSASAMMVSPGAGSALPLPSVDGSLKAGIEEDGQKQLQKKLQEQQRQLQEQERIAKFNAKKMSEVNHALINLKVGGSPGKKRPPQSKGNSLTEKEQKEIEELEQTLNETDSTGDESSGSASTEDGVLCGSAVKAANSALKKVTGIGESECLSQGDSVLSQSQKKVILDCNQVLDDCGRVEESWDKECASSSSVGDNLKESFNQLRHRFKSIKQQVSDFVKDVEEADKKGNRKFAMAKFALAKQACGTVKGIYNGMQTPLVTCRISIKASKFKKAQ